MPQISYRAGLLWTLFIYALCCFGLLTWVTEGFSHFNYTLDDPYIHLKLAQNIWHGHYGFNMDEFSSPSSSIIWPFLLAPFAFISVFEFLPLILNLLLATGCAAVFYGIFVRMGYRHFVSIVFAIFSMILINGFGLAINGLEHVLQISVVVLIAFATLGYSKEKSETHFIQLVGFITLGVMVRYEMLVFWAAYIVFFALEKNYRRAAMVLVIPLIPIILFSIFLKFLGLGVLPDSVIAKTTGNSSLLASVFKSLLNNVQEGQGQCLLGLCVVGSFFVIKNYKSRQWLALLIIPTILHLLVGRFGWFYRYEVYILTFLGLMAFMQAPQLNNKKTFAIALVLSVIAYWPYLTSVGKLHQAVRNIRYQQGVMAEFVQNYLNEPIGINDIGLIGFRYKNEVLDLWGLASREALKARLSNTDMVWVNVLAQKKNVEILIVYSAWISPDPSQWVLVGELTSLEKNVVLGGNVVSFYTKPARTNELKEKLEKFSTEVQGPFSISTLN